MEKLNTNNAPAAIVTDPIYANTFLFPVLGKLSFLEFSDDFDEKYFYIFQVNARYMKKWREERCPNIFKIEIDKETLEIKKEVIFKKIDPVYV